MLSNACIRNDDLGRHPSRTSMTSYIVRISTNQISKGPHAQVESLKIRIVLNGCQYETKFLPIKQRNRKTMH